MWRERRRVKAFFLLFVALMSCSVACAREDKYIGVYKSLSNSPPGYPEVYLELKKGGEGLRRVGEETLPFRWDVKGDEIRIHTRSGGIIVGQLQENDTLVIKLPGPEITYFKKMK
jgi:hypothetical protein